MTPPDAVAAARKLNAELRASYPRPDAPWFGVGAATDEVVVYYDRLNPWFADHLPPDVDGVPVRRMPTLPPVLA